MERMFDFSAILVNDVWGKSEIQIPKKKNQTKYEIGNQSSFLSNETMFQAKKKIKKNRQDQSSSFCYQPPI